MRIQALFLELPAQTQDLDFLAWMRDSGAGTTLRYPGSLMAGELEDPAEVYVFSLQVATAPEMLMTLPAL